MKLVDTHCHLDFDAYDDDLEEVLKRARQTGVERILNPGIDLESSERILQLTERYSDVYAAVGIHPNSATRWKADSNSRLADLARHPSVVAIGEIGLDYYRDRAPRDLQREVLERQLQVAQDLKLPLVIHVRNADRDDRSCIIDVLQTLQTWQEERHMESHSDRLGVLHSFSGNAQEARRAVELGFYVGITGPVTFKNAHTMREVVSSVPLRRLLIETDGPFLTPHPHRGQRNEPAYVQHVAQRIAEVKGVSARAVAQSTTENADRLFQWR